MEKMLAAIIVKCNISWFSEFRVTNRHGPDHAPARTFHNQVPRGYCSGSKVRRNLLYVWTAGCSNCTVEFFKNRNEPEKPPIWLPAITFAKHTRLVKYELWRFHGRTVSTRKVFFYNSPSEISTRKMLTEIIVKCNKAWLLFISRHQPPWARPCSSYNFS